MSNDQDLRPPEQWGDGLNPEIQPPIPPPAPSPSAKKDDEADDEDEGMLRMSFMDHLEELRSRLISILSGAGVAFLVSMIGANYIWAFVQAPLREAVDKVHGEIIAITPMEQFTIIYLKAPVLATLFLASPWIIYQIWAFIAPGLYPRERRWAAPFILITAGLFVAGGAFGYYVAFRYGLVFLLGLGGDSGVKAAISIESYFDLFVNVIVGVSILFELPVVVFFLTLLRITTPGFLIRNSRYAILAIVVLAAIVTPTPDPLNLALFAVPMIVLFFLGVFASYLLVLNREGQKFPWKAFFIWIGCVLVLVGAVVALMITQYNYKLVPYSPFLVK